MNKKERVQLRTQRQIQKEWRVEEHQLMSKADSPKSVEAEQYRPMEIYISGSGMPKCRFVDK